jgi:signal transduction histidine kinase
MNVAKHARASKTEVAVDVAPDSITLTVTDDGIGVGPNIVQSGGLGVRNITERATRLGGEATFALRNPSGTEMRWSVPR